MADPRHRATADDLYVTLHGIAAAYVATSTAPLALPSSVRRAFASLVASHQRKPAWSPRGRDRACTDGDGIEDMLDDDIDGDGISHEREFQIGTFPYKPDSDGDGVDDPTEIDAGTDPTDPRVF